jgi:hypothetical protein
MTVKKMTVKKMGSGSRHLFDHNLFDLPSGCQTRRTTGTTSASGRFWPQLNLCG